MNFIHFRQVFTTLGGIDDDGLYLKYCPLAAYYASGSKHRIKSILEEAECLASVIYTILIHIGRDVVSESFELGDGVAHCDLGPVVDEH